MRKKGLLIVFEGLDGSGKATQFELFKEFLNSEKAKGRETQIKLFKKELDNIYTKDKQFDLFSSYLKDLQKSFVTYDFPRYYDNYWGKMVGRFLAGEFGKKVDPYLRSIYYLLDQADASKTMRKELKQGKIVICNRYITSSYIFQTALVKGQKKKDEFVNWLEKTGYEKLGIIRPDVVICLYVPFEQAQKLIMKKAKREYIQGKSKDINEENLILQKNAAKEMIRFCDQKRNWHLINCMEGDKLKTPERISGEIQETIKKYLI